MRLAGAESSSATVDCLSLDGGYRLPPCLEMGVRFTRNRLYRYYSKLPLVRCWDYIGGDRGFAPSPWRRGLLVIHRCCSMQLVLCLLRLLRLSCLSLAVFFAAEARSSPPRSTQLPPKSMAVSMQLTTVRHGERYHWL